MSTPELPEAHRSTPAQRVDPREPDSSGTNLSIREAVARFAVGERTLRAQLAEGLAGVHKVPGPRGEEWRIPIATLEALYAERTGAGATEPQQEERSAHTEELIDTLRTQIEDYRQQTQRALEAGDAARARVDELIERAATAEAQLEATRSQLEAMRARRWWQRR